MKCRVGGHIILLEQNNTEWSDKINSRTETSWLRRTTKKGGLTTEQAQRLRAENISVTSSHYC